MMHELTVVVIAKPKSYFSLGHPRLLFKLKIQRVPEKRGIKEIKLMSLIKYLYLNVQN